MKRPTLALALLLMGGTSLAAQQSPNQSGPSPAGQQVAPVSDEQRVAADAIDKILADGKVILLDVREPKELEDLGTREGYINIPIGELEKRLHELPKDKTILTA